jgi:hypothetical protein
MIRTVSPTANPEAEGTSTEALLPPIEITLWYELMVPEIL